MATKQGFLRNLRDAALLKTFTGPVGAGATGAAAASVSAAIDLDSLTPQGERPQGLELVIRNPAIGTGALVGSQTLELIIENDAGTGFTGPTQLQKVVLTGNTGAPAGEVRVGVSSNAFRYVRAKVNAPAGDTGDASTVTFDFSVVI